MKISLLSNTNPRLRRLVIHTADPDETLRVKRLPGRYYDHLQDAWIVPITLGLAQALEKSISPLGSALAALIAEQEEALHDAIYSPAPPVTQAQLFEMPAVVALDRALEHHLYAVHNGDREDFARHHDGPIDHVPDLRPARRGATRREKKNKTLKKVEIS